jgi:hypothetical protein
VRSPIDCTAARGTTTTRPAPRVVKTIDTYIPRGTGRELRPAGVLWGLRRSTYRTSGRRTLAAALGGRVRGVTE